MYAVLHSVILWEWPIGQLVCRGKRRGSYGWKASLQSFNALARYTTRIRKATNVTVTNS